MKSFLFHQKGQLKEENELALNEYKRPETIHKIPAKEQTKRLEVESYHLDSIVHIQPPSMSDLCMSLCSAP
jgi:hypothetical protein